LKQIQFLGASVLCILGEIGGIITLNIIQIQVSYSFPSLFLLFVQTFLLVARLIFLFFFLNFTFNNNRRQQTVDVVEHGWLELNQGTRNMIQLNVSDLVYSNQHSNMFCLKIKRY
jgi:hypothetical protein